MDLIHKEQFFETARERYAIRLRRLAGNPAPWSADPVFRQWYFCNVHREHDKTTEWFRKNVRDLAQSPVEATVAFRWFNRIETGERIKDLLVGEWNTEEARRRLQGVKPVVTGAYIIKGCDGMEKLDGVLWCIDQARAKLPAIIERWDREGASLESAWRDLLVLDCMGPFMAYEVVSDLRWTPVLDSAVDIMTWANPGPGCMRGMSRLVYGRPDVLRTKDKPAILEAMCELLIDSQNPDYWPREWEPWEMREVEHWLCEFDKYQRVALDKERMKRRFAW
jgi:hypothetical protein